MNYPEPKNNRSRAIISTTIKTALTAGLIYWLIKSGSIRLEYLFVPIERAPALLAGCIALLLGLSFSVLRFKELLKGVETPLSFLKCAKIISIMYFFSQCVLGPASGDFARYFYTVKETQKGARAGAAIMADRIIGTMGLIGLSGLGMILNWSLVESSPELKIVAIPLLALLCTLWMSLVLGIISLIKGRTLSLSLGIIFLCFAIFTNSIGQSSFLIETISPLLIYASIAALIAALIAPEFLEEGWIYKNLFSKFTIGSKIGELLSALLLFRNYPLILMRTIFITGIQHMLFILSLYLFSQSQSLPQIPNFGEIFFAAPFSFLAGLIPAPAAGLGVNEAAFETLLSLVSNGAISAGASIYLMMRIWMTLASLSAVPMLLRNKSKKVAR